MSEPTATALGAVRAWTARSSAPGAVAMAIGLVVRCIQVSGRAAIWAPDSDAYLRLSTLPLGGGERWAGSRTPLVPLLLDITGGRPGTAFMYLQIAVAAAGWGFLAGEVARHQPTPRRRWTMAALVLALSLTTPITLWDRLVLTETLTLALMAVVVALLLRYLRTTSPWPLVGTVPVAVLWAAGRDTVALVLISGAALATLMWAFGDRRRRVVPAVSAALVLVALLALGGAAAGHRDRSPMANVFAVRVMPYPDRIDWFEDHGMPAADRFREARAELSDPSGSEAPLVPISRRNMADDPWWQWLERDGKVTYLRFVLSHPAFLLTEPLEKPHRSFHSGGGHTGKNFEADDLRKVPLLTAALWWPTGWVMAALGAAAVGWLVAGRPRHPLFSVAALTAITGSVYGLAAWHGDGMEAARHVFVGGAALRLAVVLVVAGATSVLVPGRSPG